MSNNNARAHPAKAPKRSTNPLAKNKEASSVAPSIDFPQEGETVKEGLYAIRISAPDNVEVEVCIDNGDWQPCRFSAGYWWFDWNPVNTGRCKVAARSRAGNDPWKESSARSCLVTNSDFPASVRLKLD